MTNNIDELIKRGEIDITTRDSVEDEADRKKRAAEPSAYALSYEEAVTVKQAHNIIETVLIQNDFVTVDSTTHTRVFTLNPDSTEKILEAFEQRGLDPDQLYNLADSVLSANWYTLLISTQYTPGNGRNFGFYLVANVNGQRDEGILKIEDFPQIYDHSETRTKQRDALRLPKDAAFLYSMELDTITTLRQICEGQFFIEEKLNYLSPVDMMPTPAAFSLVARFINNPHVREKLPSTTVEQIRWTQDGNEVQLHHSTRNTETTLTISDYLQFFETATENTPVKRRRGTLSGVKKVWRFALQKLMQQSTPNAMPKYIVIDLDEMVELKMFTTIDNAYRGVETMVKKMGLLHIAQDFDTGRGTKKSHGGFLFYHSSRHGTIAHIFVNDQFGFEFFRRQYTYFPTAWAYQLDGNSFSLVEYIFTIMRQNAAQIEDKGKLKIKLSTVCDHLGIRTVEDVRENCNRRYADFIKKPIMQAVKEVNSAAKQDKEIQGRFKISIKTTDTSNIEKWLSGYLEIAANGEYTNHLTGIAETQRLYDSTLKEERVRQAAKRRARPKTTKKKYHEN